RLLSGALGVQVDAWDTARMIGAHIGAHHTGSLLADDTAYPAMFMTGHPEWFVTPANPRFDRLLTEPGPSVQYVLLADPAFQLTRDAINRTYPTLYVAGTNWAVLEVEWSDSPWRGGGWRLYRVSR